MWWIFINAKRDFVLYYITDVTIKFKLVYLFESSGTSVLNMVRIFDPLVDRLDSRTITAANSATTVSALRTSSFTTRLYMLRRTSCVLSVRRSSQMLMQSLRTLNLMSMVCNKYCKKYYNFIKSIYYRICNLNIKLSFIKSSNFQV